VVTTSAKRINLGGKALTNYLKELVSYRAWNVMDETYIMEDVKERLCFVSADIERDLNIARLDSPLVDFTLFPLWLSGVRFLT